MKANIAAVLSLIIPLAFANNEQQRFDRSNDLLNDVKPDFFLPFTLVFSLAL